AQITTQLPIFIHNFSNYDCHFLIPVLGSLREQGIIKCVEAIPKSSEKFMSIIIDKKVKFLDSLGFTLKGLGALVSVLKKDRNAIFEITAQEFKSEVENGSDLELLFQKGAYPYTLMKSCKDFERTELPPKEAFYNDLAEEAIEDLVYEHALQVWRSFNIKNMGE